MPRDFLTHQIETVMIAHLRAELPFDVPEADIRHKSLNNELGLDYWGFSQAASFALDQLDRTHNIEVDTPETIVIGEGLEAYFPKGRLRRVLTFFMPFLDESGKTPDLYLAQIVTPIRAHARLRTPRR